MRLNKIILLTLLLSMAGSPLLWAVAPESDSTTAAALPASAGTSLTVQSVQTLSFAQALSLARQKNRQYLIATEAKSAADAACWQAALRFGPTADLQFGYLLDNKAMVTTMDLGGMAMSYEIPPNYYAGRLVVTQPLFAGFKIWNGLTISKLQAQNADASYQLADSQLYLDVTEAYYGLKIAEDVVQVTEEFIKQTQEHVQVVKAKYREGSVSNYDLLRSEVQLANLKPQLLKTKIMLALARKKLAMTLGFPVDTQVQAQEEVKITFVELGSMSQFQDQAIRKRLDLMSMERVTQMARIGHTLALTSNAPLLALSGTWTYYDTLDKDFPPAGENLKHSWEIMLGLSWPIWDNLAAIPKTLEAAAKVRQSELGQQSMSEGIRMEVEALYLGLQASQETLAAQQKTIQQAETGCRIAEQQYAGGLMTNLDVMDAQLALNQAKMNYLQTQLECLLGQIKLKKAVGEEFK